MIGKFSLKQLSHFRSSCLPFLLYLPPPPPPPDMQACLNLNPPRVTFNAPGFKHCHRDFFYLSRQYFFPLLESCFFLSPASADWPADLSSAFSYPLTLRAAKFPRSFFRLFPSLSSLRIALWTRVHSVGRTNLPFRRPILSFHFPLQSATVVPLG